MNIIEYVRGMSPVHERKELLSSIRQLKEALNDHALPAARQIASDMDVGNFKSDYNKTLTKALQRKVTLHGPTITALTIPLERISENIELLESETKRLFGFTFSSRSLTYNRAQLIRYIEGAHFYVRYFTKMALRLVAEESMVKGQASRLQWAKAEMEWLDQGLAAFVEFYPLADKDTRALKEVLQRTSNAEIQEETHEAAIASLGERKLDPMGLYSSRSNFSSLNPLMFMGKMLAEHQATEYKKTKEEHQAIQLRLQEYRELADTGRSTPKLQKLIQYTEQRIERLDYTLARIEEENRPD